MATDDRCTQCRHCMQLSFFFLLLFIHVSIAQKTDRAGYVVTNAGDTLNGVFTSARWDTSPKQFSFTGPNGKELFKPADIKSFYVADEFYESAVVEVDHSVGSIRTMNYSTKPEFVRDTLFVQVIFKGSKSLYYHKSANGWKYFFFKDGPGPLEQLVYRKYRVDEKKEGIIKTYVRESNFYIRQLKVLFIQCPNLSAAVEKVEYEMNSLENLFKKYAGCAGEAVEEIEKVKRLEVDLLATAGMNQSNLEFSSTEPAFLAFTDGDFKTKRSPDVGLGVSVHSLRRARISASLFLLYTNLKVTGSHYSAIARKESKMDFSYNCFGSYFNFGIRPIRSLPFYVTVGGVVGGLTETHSEWVEIYPSTVPRPRNFESTDFQSGFTSSIGYQFNRVNLELMADRTNGISSYPNLVSRISRFHLLVKYSFFRKLE